MFHAFCLLAFCAHALAQVGAPFLRLGISQRFSCLQTPTEGLWGYDTAVSAPRAEGRFVFKYSVADALFPARNSSGHYHPGPVALIIQTAAADAGTQGGQIKLFLRKDEVPVGDATQGDIKLTDKSIGTRRVRNEVDITSLGPGEYYLLGIAQCLGCRETANVKVTAFISWAGTVQPFPLDGVTGKYTALYEGLTQGHYGHAGWLDATGDRPVYIRTRLVMSEDKAVTMVFHKGSPPSQDPAGATTETFKRFPAAGQNITGSYTTDAIALSEGRWYIAPYGEIIPLDAGADVEFAVGIGFVPTSAALRTQSSLAAAPASWAALATLVSVAFRIL